MINMIIFAQINGANNEGKIIRVDGIKTNGSRLIEIRGRDAGSRCGYETGLMGQKKHRRLCGN